MKKSTQKVLDPKKDVLTRLKHLRALLGEAHTGPLESGALPRRGPGGVRSRDADGVGWGWRGVPPNLWVLALFSGKPQPDPRALRCKLTPSSHRVTSRQNTTVTVPSPANTGPQWSSPTH